MTAEPEPETEYEFRVGEPVVAESRPSEPPFVVVFEDDGEMGYLYVLDLRRGDDAVIDALHIYNAGEVSDAEEPSRLRFSWSADEQAVTLIVNGYAHAMVDFAVPVAMCANNFPPPGPDAPFPVTHEWDEQVFAATFPGIPSEWGWRQQQAGS